MTKEKVNWALVGLGDIVRKRVGAALLAQPNSRLYACVTRNPSHRADELAHLRPERVYVDVEEMLDDPEIDAVYLATPVYLHAQHAIAALQSGKHVIIEKPVARNTEEGQQICRAAEEVGRFAAAAYYRRFWPTFQQIKNMLDAGELGQIVMIRVALHSWYSPPVGDPKSWRVQPGLSGGGVLSDVGSHRLDLLAWWFGLPKRVVADLRVRTHDYAAEDSATAILLFGDGIPCTFSCQWNSKSWADELHIVGTEGSASFPSLDGDELVVTRGRDVQRRTFTRHENAHYDLIDDFAGSIDAGRTPRFSVKDGLAATRITDAMQRSSMKGSWVEIDCND
jgi:1,5-anhydro-D-fructose reductase (1,5-anhydro-D-mannitol-forming)